MNEILVNGFGALDDEIVMEELKKMQGAGTDTLAILGNLQAGMQVVGKKFEEKEYYLSELIMAAEIFKESIEAIGGIGNVAVGKNHGTMVLGTVQGDIHDIGKNIVAAVMGCNGFNIIDLGVDVPIEKFVATVKENKPDFVGISCLLTTNFENMRKTIEEVRAANDATVKFIIGGGPCDAGTLRFVGADALAKDAQEGIEIANKMLGVN